MKKYYLTLLTIGFFIFSNAQVTISPDPFEVDESITITLDTNSGATDCNGFSNPTKIYIHSGVATSTNPWTYVTGNCGQDDGIGRRVGDHRSILGDQGLDRVGDALEFLNPVFRKKFL